jgi:hypothetical protein
MRLRWPDRSFFAPAIMPLVEASQRKFGHPDLQTTIKTAKFVYAIGGWVWSTFHFAWALEFAMMAEDLDPVHFPHWGELPEEGMVRCPVCGGRTQPPIDGWHAVPTAGR